MILARPDNLQADQPDLLARTTAVCPETSQLATVVGDFAELLTPCAENAEGLSHWIVQVRAADPPHLHAFTRGLERDRDAVVAALTLPYGDGPTEGVNTKTKRIAPPDARTSRLHPASPSHPSRTAARSVTTEYETGPFI